MAAKTPEDLDRLFGEHLNAGALEALVSLYEPDAVLVQQDGSMASGQSAISAALAQFLALKPRIRMHVVRTIRAGGSLAVLRNDWTATATSPEGDPIEVAGKAIEVVRRQADGNWLFVVDEPFALG